MSSMMRRNKSTDKSIKSTIESQSLLKNSPQLAKMHFANSLIVDSSTEKKIMVCFICGKTLLRDFNKINAKCDSCLEDEKKWKKRYL